MYILGISCYYHDSAAALIKDGKVVAAAEEERFSRIKHDNGFPHKAIEFCLASQNIDIDKIDYIAYYEKPLRKFERILETFVTTYPFSLKPFVKGVPEWFEYKIKVGDTIRRSLKYKGEILYVPHHVSHAAAGFFTSSFKNAAILTVDGVGEYQTTGLWTGEGKSVTPIATLNFPHSLGLLYSAFTAFLGFRVNDDEYKVMGLAAYGKPTYVKQIYQIINLKEDGSFQLKMEYFAFRESFRMWSGKFQQLFGTSRKQHETVRQRHKDIAASIQQVTEEIYFAMLNHLYSETTLQNLCIAGGVGLNAVANGKIYERTKFKKVHVYGPAGDSGGAVGAALYVWHARANSLERRAKSLLSLGSEYSNTQIQNLLANGHPEQSEGSFLDSSAKPQNDMRRATLRFQFIADESELLKKVAKLLAEGKVVGWFQGRMEFGPRALGNRSILARPYPRGMKDTVNQIKIRELFRPFAGSILQEKAHEYFEVPEKNHYSPHMNFCFVVREEKRKELAAIVHADNTCRIQTVSKDNGRYYRLIKEFYKQTGIACVLNTSFNLKGEPIVETPEQAIDDFLKTKMDYLVMEDFILDREYI